METEASGYENSKIRHFLFKFIRFGGSPFIVWQLLSGDQRPQICFSYFWGEGKRCALLPQRPKWPRCNEKVQSNGRNSFGRRGVFVFLQLSVSSNAITWTPPCYYRWPFLVATENSSTVLFCFFSCPGKYPHLFFFSINKSLYYVLKISRNIVQWGINISLMNLGGSIRKFVCFFFSNF